MSKKILIVEDDDIFLEVMTSMFDYAGYQTISAINGKEGYEKFLLEKPDCVVTDIMMPILNGVELTKKIFSSDQPVPVVIMSGFTSNKDLVELGKSPLFVGFFTKPFEEEAMLSAISQALVKK